MTRVGFEPKFPMFEQVKTFRALDRSVTVIGYVNTDLHYGRPRVGVQVSVGVRFFSSPHRPDRV
jgi:hypothetical protein